MELTRTPRIAGLIEAAAAVAGELDSLGFQTGALSSRLAARGRVGGAASGGVDDPVPEFGTLFERGLAG